MVRIVLRPYLATKPVIGSTLSGSATQSSRLATKPAVIVKLQGIEKGREKSCFPSPFNILIYD